MGGCDRLQMRIKMLLKGWDWAGWFDDRWPITLKLQGLPLVEIPACLRKGLESNLPKSYKSFSGKRLEREWRELCTRSFAPEESNIAFLPET